MQQKENNGKEIHQNNKIDIRRALRINIATQLLNAQLNGNVRYCPETNSDQKLKLVTSTLELTDMLIAEIEYK